MSEADGPRKSMINLKFDPSGPLVFTFGALLLLVDYLCGRR